MSDSIITNIEKKIELKNQNRDFDKEEKKNEEILSKVNEVLVILKGLDYSSAYKILQHSIRYLGKISKVG